MVSVEDIQNVRSGAAISRDGEKIGRINDVYVDDMSGQPAWVTLTSGLFSQRTIFAPLLGAVVEGAFLKLAFTKDVLTNAPAIADSGHISDIEQQQLLAYFGAQLEPAPAQPEPDQPVHAHSVPTPAPAHPEPASAYVEPVPVVPQLEYVQEPAQVVEPVLAEEPTVVEVLAEEVAVSETPVIEEPPAEEIPAEPTPEPIAEQVKEPQQDETPGEEAPAQESFVEQSPAEEITPEEPPMEPAVAMPVSFIEPEPVFVPEAVIEPEPVFVPEPVVEPEANVEPEMSEELSVPVHEPLPSVAPSEMQPAELSGKFRMQPSHTRETIYRDADGNVLYSLLETYDEVFPA